MKSKIDPNFLYIGPDKAGSSWIFALLRQHPNCFVPDCKDIYFFDRYYDRGINWYRSFFSQARPDMAIGELSHDYLFSSIAALRIKSDFSSMKLIACLRNPAERSFSHYLYMVRSGRTRLPFLRAIEKYPEIISNSLYYRHLKIYYSLFDSNSIKILFFDDLQSNPKNFAKEIFRFLKIDESFDKFDWENKERSASAPRIFLLSAVVKTLANIARRLRMEKLIGVIKHHKWSKILYSTYTEENKPTLSSVERSIINEYFHEDLKSLEDLLCLKLNHWR